MSVKGGIDRKQQILESLARELEHNHGGRITTAGLARAVGVSEAALYRHFPSKARMFEGLIDFAEDAVFSRVNRILAEQEASVTRCRLIAGVALGFSARNPGITRILLGDVLAGEPERLHRRASQYFSRLETQLKQVFREGEMRERGILLMAPEIAANMLLALLEGRMRQFVRSGFSHSPLEHWEIHWEGAERALFRTVG